LLVRVRKGQEAGKSLKHGPHSHLPFVLYRGKNLLRTRRQAEEKAGFPLASEKTMPTPRRFKGESYFCVRRINAYGKGTVKKRSTATDEVGGNFDSTVRLARRSRAKGGLETPHKGGEGGEHTGTTFRIKKVGKMGGVFSGRLKTSKVEGRNVT